MESVEYYLTGRLQQIQAAECGGTREWWQNTTLVSFLTWQLHIVANFEPMHEIQTSHWFSFNTATERTQAFTTQS